MNNTPSCLFRQLGQTSTLKQALLQKCGTTLSNAPTRVCLRAMTTPALAFARREERKMSTGNNNNNHHHIQTSSSTAPASSSSSSQSSATFAKADRRRDHLELINDMISKTVVMRKALIDLQMNYIKTKEIATSGSTASWMYPTRLDDIITTSEDNKREITSKVAELWSLTPHVKEIFDHSSHRSIDQDKHNANNLRRTISTLLSMQGCSASDSLQENTGHRSFSSAAVDYEEDDYYDDGVADAHQEKVEAIDRLALVDEMIGRTVAVRQSIDELQTYYIKTKEILTTGSTVGWMYPTQVDDILYLSDQHKHQITSAVSELWSMMTTVKKVIAIDDANVNDGDVRNNATTVTTTTTEEEEEIEQEIFDETRAEELKTLQSYMLQEALANERMLM